MCVCAPVLYNRAARRRNLGELFRDEQHSNAQKQLSLLSEEQIPEILRQRLPSFPSGALLLIAKRTLIHLLAHLSVEFLSKAKYHRFTVPDLSGEHLF